MSKNELEQERSSIIQKMIETGESDWSLVPKGARDILQNAVKNISEAPFCAILNAYLAGRIHVLSESKIKNDELKKIVKESMGLSDNILSMLNETIKKWSVSTDKNLILQAKNEVYQQNFNIVKIEKIISQNTEEIKNYISEESQKVIMNNIEHYISLPEAARVIYDELEDRRRHYSGTPKLKIDTIRKKLAYQLTSESYLRSGNRHYFPVSIVAQKAHNVCSEIAIDSYIPIFKNASKRESELKNPQHVIPG